MKLKRTLTLSGFFFVLVAVATLFVIAYRSKIEPQTTRKSEIPLITATAPAKVEIEDLSALPTKVRVRFRPSVGFQVDKTNSK
jgi:hypothetical protein